MQPNYFEIAKSLQLAHGQATLDRLKQAEKVAEPTLIQCENCRDHFEPDDIISNDDGIQFCSECCRDEFEDKNADVDDTCGTCLGTGEGQNEYVSCHVCRGTGVSK